MRRDAGGRGEHDAPTRIVAIFGPTASGKSDVAELVAERLATEVVSADALQVYSGIPIVTNQPARPTRLVAIRGLDEEMSLGEYAELAHAELDEVLALHGRAVLCGGTGLYLRAALHDLRIPPAPAPGVREATERSYDADPAAAFARLAELDPAAAARVHPNDRRRVVRALELAAAGASLVPRQDALWSDETRHPTLLVGLEVGVEQLEARIRGRAAEMVARGAVDEARRAVGGPISRTAAKALGLVELAELEPGAAVEHLVVATRRYAAYQRKWMRRIPGIVAVDAERPASVVAEEIVGLAIGE